jgi:hypothetical protein
MIISKFVHETIKGYEYIEPTQKLKKKPKAPPSENVWRRACS